MEIVKKAAGTNLITNNYFADPYLLELVINGLLGVNVKARIAIHEYLDKNLSQLREEERRLEGQLGQVQERRQGLEVLNSLLALLDLHSANLEGENNLVNYQNILSEITALTGRLCGLTSTLVVTSTSQL